MPVSQWCISIVLSIIIQPSLAQDVTERGNACHFPFEYLNRTFHECITIHHNDMPWCSTTYNFTRDGKWAECTVGYCNEQQWPIKVKNTKTSNSHQSSYLYQCEEGYQSGQNLTVTCNSNPKYGRWNWTEETIEQAIKCEHIECAVDKLIVTNGTINSTRSYYLGDEIELDCEYGYFPSAPVCNSSSQWTYPPRCNHRGECDIDEKPTLKNGHWNITVDRRYYGGDLLSYNCDNSTSSNVPGSQSIVCLSDFSWFGDMNCNLEPPGKCSVSAANGEAEAFLSGREVGVGVGGICIGALFATVIALIYVCRKPSPEASISRNDEESQESQELITLHAHNSSQGSPYHIYDYATTPADSGEYLQPKAANSQRQPTHMTFLKDGSH